ncbi:ATP-grasp domain-containing protein [Deinococcus cellulosilyticus]|uniref:Carboxylate--amine ligase n=1 Tax=Deinococcus cellulosilyticus (strain DSM 18568 / NBRC 106333 / KACC 11606 / 5516J-15) TaxID=1223518 RepID=A0A511MVR5_DEIC1|nr:ATP-grasp domain-containing protein [Deinococcus cellulosilyticus]GEM44675.1 carboxylate--amine ligase [Deinococcus cellulosilyticus NBRC 106333 = KACC 11606]
MSLTLALIAYLPTDAVTQGFLPAAQKLGWKVMLYTDVPELHHKAYEGLSFKPEIIEADVFQVQSLIEAVASHGKPDVVFSNSDHLQTQTALLAEYFGLPGKPWKAAYRAKNKAAMRRQLEAPDFYHTVLHPDQDWHTNHPYPVVLKPREGVASRHAYYIPDALTLRDRVQQVWSEEKIPLVVEQYLTGQLYTLETLGDGETIQVLGGFKTRLSPPPYFLEETMEWQPDLPAEMQQQVLEQLAKLGVGLGACHTEFVWKDSQASLIEVNYRNIGDQCDLLLQDLLEFPLFEWVLRLHAGEKLPALEFPRKHALVHYLFAKEDGTVTVAPENQTFERNGTITQFQVLSKVGSQVDGTSSKRSFLGVLRMIGPDPVVLQDTLHDLERSLEWRIASPHPVLIS